MTHEHDFELIAAIAEGVMGPAEEAAAEASLASCGECRIDLQFQREALAALRAAPVVGMTDLERAGLHREVATATTPPTRKPAPHRSVPWFQRLVPAMAAAAALVVVGGVGSLLIGNDGADFDDAAETTSVASESPRAGAEEEFTELGDPLRSEDMAEATPTSLAALAPAESAVDNLGEISKTELQNAAFRLTSEPADDGAADAGSNLEAMTLEAELVCVETASGEGAIMAVQRASVEGVEVEIYLIEDRVDVYARPDCSLFDSFE